MRNTRGRLFAEVVGVIVVVASILVLVTTTAWALTGEQEAILLSADGVIGDFFGADVAVDGDTAVVGSIFDDDNGHASGSAYVFARIGNSWMQQAKLLPADGADDDNFGRSVALDGDTAIIGAQDDNDNGHNSGSAYVFVRSAGVWTEQAKLLPADGTGSAQFGIAVAIDGDTVVVGAHRDTTNGFRSGSAHIFTRDVGVWTEQAKLLPVDGAAEDTFGVDVAVDGDTTVIGAGGDDDGGLDSGSAYVFTRTAGVWTEQAKLLPADGADGDDFGASVAVDGDSTVIGARFDDDHGPQSGSAYVFTRTAGVWTEQAKLLPIGGAAYYEFGSRVAHEGDIAVIGAPRDDEGGGDSGAVHLFARTGSGWMAQDKLLASDGAPSDYFGNAVALAGDTVVIGAPQADSNGGNSGSAYVFRLQDDGGEVPAVSGIGTALLLLTILGAGAYWTRRRPTR